MDRSDWQQFYNKTFTNEEKEIFCNVIFSRRDSKLIVPPYMADTNSPNPLPILVIPLSIRVHCKQPFGSNHKQIILDRISFPIIMSFVVNQIKKRFNRK